MNNDNVGDEKNEINAVSHSCKNIHIKLHSIVASFELL